MSTSFVKVTGNAEPRGGIYKHIGLTVLYMQLRSVSYLILFLPSGVGLCSLPPWLRAPPVPRQTGACLWLLRIGISTYHHFHLLPLSVLVLV